MFEPCFIQWLYLNHCRKYKLNYNSNQCLFYVAYAIVTLCARLIILQTYVSDEDTHAYLSFWSIFTPENFPCLVHLRLPCLDLEGVVSDVTFHLPLLTNLSFCACDRLSDSDIAKLAGSVIRNSPSLDKLHLRERGFDDELFLALKEELPKTCPNKFLVDSGFMDQPGLMPRPTYTMPLKDVCYGVTHYLETHARSFDLNLKFALPEDDCCSRLSDSTVECEYH